MKKILLGIIVCLSTQIIAQNYHYKVDLNQIADDQLQVELKIPALKQKELYFQMPAMVPGTYSVYNFGRFVSNFKAFDADGKPLETEHPDINTWKILSAKKAAVLRYTVEDTWDTKKSNVIFEPAGTNIDKEVMVFNNHGIFGFFRKFEKLPFKLEIKRSEQLFGGTAMQRTGGDNTTDVFETESYNTLVDNPILFAPADTAQIQVGKAKVLIHTYSPTGKVSSKALVADIQPILEAQKNYLGGTLPVDRYAFLIFLNAEGDFYLSGSAGALEHSYSSFYCLFEGEATAIAQTVRDVAAHEFFHIVTPLNIHSEQIHNFNFMNPEMSRHLWLYEGGTEYAAQHVQVKQGLVSVEQFLSAMSQKMQQADMFDNSIPFTTMSLTCLDENKKQYPNVYLKGALINMCLDMQLRILSDGRYGTQEMLRDLSKKYGVNKSFKDKKLFKEIAKITGFKKETQAFFELYVDGNKPLPVAAMMQQMGIEYQEMGTTFEVSPFGFSPNGGITFNYEQKKLELLTDGIDAFGKDMMGFEGGDLLYQWQGEILSMENIQQVMTKHAMSAVEGAELKVVVLRKDAEGAYQEVALKANLRKVPVTTKHAFVVDKEATDLQLKLRKAWLGEQHYFE